MTLKITHIEMHVTEGLIVLDRQNIEDALRLWLKEKVTLPDGTLVEVDLPANIDGGAIRYRRILREERDKPPPSPPADTAYEPSPVTLTKEVGLLEKATGNKANLTMFTVRGGGMVDFPFMYKKAGRQSAWAAVIRQNGTAPGGADRVFLQKGRGDVGFLLAGVRVGDVLEFACDSHGTRRREFLIVIELHADHMTTLPCVSMKDAFDTRAALETP